jgi:hypothetical protein
MACSFEHRDETSGFIKYGESADKLKIVILPDKDSAP